MTGSHPRFSLSARAALFLGVLAVLGAFAASSVWIPTTHAQEAWAQQDREELSPETTVVPAIALQYASVVSAANTITITRAPVTTSTGAVVYKDITLQLAVSTTGGVTVAPGYPKVVTSPNLLVGSLKAGTYTNASYYGIVLTGPGIGQGVTVWNIATAPQYNEGVPASATIWMGPRANSPIANRLKAANITSTNWTYGTVWSPNNNYGTLQTFQQNDIIGISQVGNTLNIACFTLNGTDQNTPVDMIIYTLKQ